MELIFERGNDPKVPAAAQALEEVLVLRLARFQKLAARGNHLGRRRLSQVSPNFRSSQPLPLPRVRPAMPVWVTRPPVVARPKT
jgi:hypothetical protein